MASPKPRTRSRSDSPVQHPATSPATRNPEQANIRPGESPRGPASGQPSRSVNPPGAASAGPEAGAFAEAPVEVGYSSTVAAQLWLPRSPWRPTAGWAVVAALLASGLLARVFFVDWRTVALALLLADPLWGSIWRLAGGRTALLALPRQAQVRGFWLPYLRPGSPAARILGNEGPPRDAPDELSVLPLVFRVALPTLLLPLAIGWILGFQALWLTVAVIVVSGLGWIARQFLVTPGDKAAGAVQATGEMPALLQSLMTVALPWTLMLSLLNIEQTNELFVIHVALVVVWTIHHWGQVRVTRWNGARHAPFDGGRGAQVAPGGLHAQHPGASRAEQVRRVVLHPLQDRLGIALLAIADLSLAALLIVAQTPLWLAPLAILWLPTYLTLYQGKRAERLAFWWLAAMLLSSAAIGSRMI